MLQEIKFDYQKATQAINYLANNYEGKKINKMMALKLIWAADRYHLRKYGRPILGDKYIAMRFGPVASNVKNILDSSMVLQEDSLEYSKTFIDEVDTYTVKSIHEVDEEVFSDTDIEALDFALKNFGEKEKFDLSELTHQYPEWKRYEDRLESGKSIWEQISYFDFFKDPTDLKNDIFHTDDEVIQQSKEIFQENTQLSNLL